MLAQSLPKVSTVETVWSGLTHQRSYVSGLLQKMRLCLKANGNAHVRIGITGTGQKPYYRVFSIGKTNEEEIFGSFYDNHDPLENAFAASGSWSERSMSFTEVENFLSEKIGFTGSKPK